MDRIGYDTILSYIIHLASYILHPVLSQKVLKSSVQGLYFLTAMFDKDTISHSCFPWSKGAKTG